MSIPTLTQGGQFGQGSGGRRISSATSQTSTETKNPTKEGQYIDPWKQALLFGAGGGLLGNEAGFNPVLSALIGGGLGYLGGNAWRSAAGTIAYYQIAQNWENTNPVSRLDFVLASGNYATGTVFRLYGVY